MIDLSTKAVHQFWKAYQDATIYRVVTFMETVESWELLSGNPEFEESFKSLTELFGKTEDLDSDTLGKEVYFIRVANALPMPRALRFLHAVDSVHPGFASKLLMYAEENSNDESDECGLFLRRNMVFERL